MNVFIDTLLDYYRSGEMFILDLQLPVYEQNEELEPEIKPGLEKHCKLIMHLI